MSKTNVRGFMIDVEKVRALSEKSGYPEVKAYHERSLGLIANAQEGGDLNYKQEGWLKRLEANVDNQYSGELG